MRTERYYIIEEKIQGRWNTSAPSTSRYDLVTAKYRLAEKKERFLGLDGIEDFRICEVTSTVKPINN